MPVCLDRMKLNWYVRALSMWCRWRTIGCYMVGITASLNSSWYWIAQRQGYTPVNSAARLEGIEV